MSYSIPVSRVQGKERPGKGRQAPRYDKGEDGVPKEHGGHDRLQGHSDFVVLPREGPRILTYYFLKAVKDGKKDMAGIYEYIRPLVEDEARSLNIEQTPSITPAADSLVGRFYLWR